MKYESVEQIIKRMSEIYTVYRVSRHSEDVAFDEWLVHYTGHDDLMDLFIAADDLLEDAPTLADPIHSPTMRTGKNTDGYCQCAVAKGDGIVCSGCGKYLW